MKLTEISGYAAQPGELVEWRLHPATVAAAAAARRDPRPPSYMQETHMRTAALLRDLGVAAPTWGGAAFDIAGVLDPGALDTALRQWIDRHETLRSGLRLAGQELERFTVSSDEVALEPSVVGHFGDGAQVVRHLEDRFDELTEPLSWPSYLVATVARGDGFTLYLAFDHSNIDAYSVANIPYELHELYAAAVAGTAAELAPVGSYVDYAALERAAADGVDAGDAVVERWRAFIETCGGGLPPFPFDVGVAPGELPEQVATCEWLLDADDASAFDAACQAAGGNFLAGVLAVAALVAYERGSGPVYRTVIPLHTRTQARWAASLGWYIGLAPIEIPVAGTRDFDQLVAIARQAARAGRPLARVPFGRVCSLLDAPVRPQSMVSYMDGRMIPGAHHWAAWNAHAFGKVTYGDDVCIWVNRSVDGLYATCRYPDRELARKSIGDFVGHARAVLSSVARSGTYVLGLQAATP